MAENSQKNGRTFTLSTIIILCLNAFIVILLTINHSSIVDRIKDGDTIILNQMKIFCEALAKLEGRVNVVERDVSRIDANQKARLERELLQYGLGKKNGEHFNSKQNR